tara:strand:+ start:202 stop:402 length:201 start_codon:yes stop_codon:yes gene_type:complete
MKDYFETVYKIDGNLPDPYGVLDVIRNASKEDLPDIISQIKAQNLDLNQNIHREVEKYEYQRDLSS